MLHKQVFSRRANRGSLLLMVVAIVQMSVVVEPLIELRNPVAFLADGAEELLLLPKIEHTLVAEASTLMAVIEHTLAALFNTLKVVGGEI